MSNSLFVEVLIDQSLMRPLDYEVPDDLKAHIQVGSRVEVPLKSTLKQGTVSALKPSSSFSNVRKVERLLLPHAALSPILWKLAEWMSQYYASPLPKVLRCFVPPNVRKQVRAREKVSPLDLANADFFATKPKTLTPEQAECLARIASSLESRTFSAHLIHGVTGSGKTEVYMQAIQMALDQNRSAILLVPEIALTSQTIERLRARFQQKIAVLHHRKSLGERSAAWDLLLQNEAQIVVGARSAIFAPARQVGLIIVDEEHDSSYKQSDEIPCYHGRDVAVMRARLEGAVVLLGSATPSLESYSNAQKGKYQLSSLKSRAKGASLPKVQIIDMKTAYDKAGGFTHFSEELIEAMKQRLEAGEQTLLFLNRRGYRRQQLCSQCRLVLKCPHCDLALTFHLASHLLSCHLCSFHREPPRQCPSCQATESLIFKGFGTEHVERALHALLPQARTLRMDRDTTTRKESHEELFVQFRSHKADILIGTQMIAKGFHFPAATLVGVLEADAALQIPDFRSGEKVFQLITQVAGRAGRAELPGEVIIQTFIPDHPVLTLASSQDFLSFYEAEMEERKMFYYPPFCRLIKILFAGETLSEVQKTATETYEKICSLSLKQAHILPVLPSGHAKVKDLYRFQCIIKTNHPSVLQHIAPLVPPSSNEVFTKIDVDPSSTFF